MRFGVNSSEPLRPTPSSIRFFPTKQARWFFGMKKARKSGSSYFGIIRASQMILKPALNPYFDSKITFVLFCTPMMYSCERARLSPISVRTSLLVNLHFVLARLLSSFLFPSMFSHWSGPTEPIYRKFSLFLKLANTR